MNAHTVVTTSATANESKLEKALKKSSKRPKKMISKHKPSKAKFDSSKAHSAATIIWSDPNVGTVHFTVKQFKLGPTKRVNGVYWAQIYVGDHTPSDIRVEFTSNLAEGLVPFHTKGGVVIDCGDREIPTLIVPVTWKGAGTNKVPHTRVKDMDNIDLILRLPNGEFIDLQAAILTRGGKFYLSIQQIASGQIVRLPPDVSPEDTGYVAVEHKLGKFIVVPLLSDHAYPGADFLKNVMPRSGPTFVKFAADDKAFVESEDLEVPSWDQMLVPDDEPGWTTGAIMLWFNPIVGGKALCADGVECFIPLQTVPNQYHQSMMKEGGFPILVPRQELYLRFEEGVQGRKATNIKPIEVGSAE